MIDDDTSLMTVLREQAGLTSPKNGCAPQGSCGGCTVIVDGKAVSSCAVPAKNAKGKHVITLEGFTEKERDIFARVIYAYGRRPVRVLYSRNRGARKTSD